MAEMDIDMREVRKFAHDLGRVDERLARWVVPVVRKAGVNVKKSMQEDLRQSSDRGFRHIASTIRLYHKQKDGFIEAESRVTKPRGALANVAYFGTSRGGGTVRDPIKAGEEEAPNFIRELEKIAEELIIK